MINISEHAKEIFVEQINVSREVLNKYEQDHTAEGTEKFYRHAKILDDICSRLDIAEQSEKNAKEVGKVLATL
ncbi:hypothetical protein [Psychrobacillus antarcticus]|uniref:hypothetical protein n=1 Tax=Psychrobacillus antarcticus TaxID=2879115 RepID=UPI0024087CBF|nr:hypothetical protein [Psychrobacillus antarcticus]